MSPALAALVLASPSACANPPPEAAVTLPAPVQFTLRRVDPGRPPLAYVRIDARIRNDAKEARWFLLPKLIEAKPGGGVDGVEVSSAGGVVIGRFHGAGGVQALLLPAGAEVTVREMVFESWAEELPAAMVLPVRVGTALTIGGEGAEAWMGPALSAGKADIAADDLKARGSRFTPDRSAVPVALAGEQVLTVPVAR